MGKGLDRTEFIRRDCPQCGGNGYVQGQGGEMACNHCGGAGFEEKEVPFKFDGERTEDELKDLWR